MKSRSTLFPVRVAILALLFSVPLPMTASGQSVVPTVDGANQLRALGVQMKRVLDHLNNTTLPDRQTLTDFDRALTRSANDPSARRAPLVEKRAALQRLRRQLDTRVRAAAVAPSYVLTMSEANSPTRARHDVETVQTGHGDVCANALGVSSALPVDLVLAAPGHGRSDAWLRFDATTAGRVRISTDSNGTDPALAVFSGCAAGAAPLDSNDDAVGLDASVTASASPAHTLYIHLTNSGAGGRVLLQVSDVNATVSGTVIDTDTHAPVPYAGVELYDTSYGGLSNFGYADDQGNYSIAVNPSSFYVFAAESGYITQVYPGLSCMRSNYNYASACPLAQAQVVNVADGGQATVNFALSRGRSISGQLRDTSNQPISSQNQAVVILTDANGNTVVSQYGDAFGRYSITTLPPGSYELRASASGYGSQMFDHKPCTGHLQQICDMSLANTVVVGDSDLTSFDFDLPMLPSIVGTVAPAPSSGTYAVGATISVSDSSGNRVAQINADDSGNYRAGPLDPGLYYVSAALGGYFSQLFSAINCGADCTYSIPLGTAVMIGNANQPARADFQLKPLPVLKGHVRDADSGLSLANVTIDFSVMPPAAQFQSIDTAVTNSAGDFAITVPAGNYYVWARSNDHGDQVFPNVPCESGDSSNYYVSVMPPCDVSGAIVLAILPDATQPALDFALVASSSISGTSLLRAGPGSDLPAFCEVDLYNGSGFEVASANVDSLGNYTVADLPASTYFALARVDSGSNFVPQIWHNLDCQANCVATTGTPILLARTTPLTGINFLINQTAAVVGQVTDTQGNPIGGVLIDAFGSSGSYVNTGVSDNLGFYSVATGTYGTFFVATEAGPKFTDQAYPSIACPAGAVYFGLCSLAGAAPINVSPANTQPQIANFVLQAADKLFHNGFE